MVPVALLSSSRRGALEVRRTFPAAEFFRIPRAFIGHNGVQKAESLDGRAPQRPVQRQTEEGADGYGFVGVGVEGRRWRARWLGGVR